MSVTSVCGLIIWRLLNSLELHPVFDSLPEGLIRRTRLFPPSQIGSHNRAIGSSMWSGMASQQFALREQSKDRMCHRLDLLSSTFLPIHQHRDEHHRAAFLFNRVDGGDG